MIFCSFRFDTSGYPKHNSKLLEAPWSNLLATNKLKQSDKRLDTIYQTLGTQGDDILTQLYSLHNNVKVNPLCVHKQTTASKQEWSKDFLSNSIAIVLLNYRTPL